MKRATLALIVGLAGFAPLGTMVHAQSGEMTQAEIVERFQAQKTRGLSIAPVTAPEQQPTANNTAVTANTAVAPVTTAANIAILPADTQVNINISFDFDSAALRADQKPKLTALCGAMNAVDGSFRILGHTDASGSEEYNKRLSKLRAEEVKRFLVSDCGIPADRLEATGVGEEVLLDPNNPRADANRRVEFQVLG